MIMVFDANRVIPQVFMVVALVDCVGMAVSHNVHVIPLVLS